MSPRTAEDNQRLRDERREEILVAARKVFTRKGLSATKISDIAAAAGVSYGLVYHYFGSKEAVYSALVNEAVQAALGITTMALNQTGTPWEQLTWLCDTMLSALREQPEHLMLVVQAFTSEATPDDVKSSVLKFGVNAAEQVAAIIAEGQRQGQVVAGDPNELALLFLALVQGLTLNRVATPDPVPPFPRVEMVLRLLKP